MKFKIYITLLLSSLIIPSIANAEEEKQMYLIKFSQDGLVHYKGSVNGLKATSPAIVGTKKLDTKSLASKAYLNYLKSDLNTMKSKFEQELGRIIGKTFDYYYANYGMALKLLPSEVAIIKNISGVIDIVKDKMYDLDTDAGPTFIGANTLWDGSNMQNNVPNKGEGVIIGVIDTGVNMDHPSFSDQAEDGYDFAAANPLGAGNFVVGSACDATFVCNNKLIGVWDFADDRTEVDGPEDSVGHGSHTASTAVGNAISAPAGGFVTVSGTQLPAPSISGVAPHAHLITYDVCVQQCSGAAIQGAINQAIADGVDVISFSISGGINPWNDSDRTYLDAVAAGIIVSTSAGNTSDSTPTVEGNVNHRGPWLFSVANSSHNRQLRRSIDITDPVPVPMELTNIFALNGGTDMFNGVDVQAGLLYAGNIEAGNEEACNAFADNTAFTGKIALIIRGSCNFADKINNAEAAGAVAVIVFNGVADTPIVMGGVESTNIPAVMIGLSFGNAIITFISTVFANDVAAFMPANALYIIDDTFGNVLNGSSLIGPNDFFDITKPDINGPGTNIFAAYANGTAPAPQFNFLTGTSMSAPHLSGSSALMVAAHPTWSPSEIRSAMMMTANSAVTNAAGDQLTPDHVGSGTVDLTKAALSALVMDETFANYLAANPSTGGNPATLNIPSARSNNCSGNCTWTRTVKNKSSNSLTWTTDEFKLIDGTGLLHVTPASFTLATDETQVISIDLTMCPGSTLNTITFGDVILNQAATNVPNSRITLAAIPTANGDCSNIPVALDTIYVGGFE